MIAEQIQHALTQVRELQQKILEKQRFKGYSGRARAMGGTIALLASIFMSTSHFPATPYAHALAWGLVFLAGFVLNFGALIHWFLFDPVVKRDVRRLKPTLDALPSLFVGGILTLVFLRNGHYQYLFGIWMSLFGLANLASRHVLPRGISMVGWFYILAGTVCLLVPSFSFMNPLPLGIVFFVGEWFGGVILHFDGMDEITIRNVLNNFLNINIGENKHAEQIR